MEGKIVVFVVVLLAIVGLIYGVYYTTDIDEATKELALASQQVGVLEQHNRSQAGFLELRKEVAALLMAAGIMNQEKEALTSEVKQLSSREEEIQQNFTDAVMKARQDAVGLVFPEVMLTNGTLLRNAKIQRVEGDVTTMLHSEGVSKIQPDLLPAELQDRFRFGVNTSSPAPLVSGMATASGNPESAPEGGTPAEKEHQKKLADAKLAKERLQKELPYLTDQLNKTKTESSAESSPSRRFYAKNRQDAIEQQITALKRRIDAADLEVQRLEALQP